MFVPTSTGLVAGGIPVADLVGGLAGQVVQGTAPAYAFPPGFELTYDQIVAPVNIASTTEATPTAIIAGTSHVYENVPYLFHFFSPQVVDSSAAGGQCVALLMQDAASIGRIAIWESITVTTQLQIAIVGELRFTPTAGAHTFGIAAFATSLTGTPSVQAGAGGLTTTAPAFLRVTKA